MSESAPVPPHLRRFVVEQDYAQYSEVDQAVWRYVLLQTYDRLQHTAHPAYRDGLAQTGISVARIPRIAEMNESLRRFGWHAVCVDGFIPPRAFQEFQAASILPIAANMRTRDHLTYTPAPDIIHEAAGHAPILPDARYASYLRAIGEASRKAFSCAADARVYAAIFDLSELKETPGVELTRVTAAEARLQRVLSEVPVVSEASRFSRLYWWTAEYGLVGTLEDYKLYGAGLLSSLWESYACHRPEVRKLPLAASCVEQGYDITRTQPQLYVARDFEQLFSVLAEVEATLVHHRGGAAALSAALTSEELATLHFQAGRFLIGELGSLWGSVDSGVLTFRGPVGFGIGTQLRERISPAEGAYRLPFGPLADGGSLSTLPSANTRCTLRFECGVQLTGVLLASTVGDRGQLFSARFADYQLGGEGAGFSERGAEYVLFAAPKFLTAEPGAHDPAFHPQTHFSTRRVPEARPVSEHEQELRSLYHRHQSVALFGAGREAEALRAYADIHEQLRAAHPKEWLLRWNLLESLGKLGQPNALAGTLHEELSRLEVEFERKEPIASGLRYLAR